MSNQRGIRINVCSVFLLHVAVQSVSTTENGMAYVASKSELEMALYDMPNDAFLVHDHAAVQPIATHLGFIASYDAMVVAQVHRKRVPDDG